MKKFKNNKLGFLVFIGLLLLISAMTFPTIAENIQIKSIEKAKRDVNIQSSEIPNLALEDNTIKSKVEDILTMTDEEEKTFHEIALLLQNSTLPKTPVNRELKDIESERMIELRKEFRRGQIKSEKTLPIGEDLEKPYFNPENETYYYPEENMTDIQILQIIDFDERLDRAFSKLNEEYVQKIMDDTEPKISEQEAIDSAKKVIEKVFDVEIDNMESICKFVVDEYHNEKSWRIVFKPENLDTLREQEKLFWMYFAKVDIYSGEVNYVDTFYSNQGKELNESVKVDLNKIDDHKKIAEEVLVNKLNAENVEFLKAYIRKSNDFKSFDKNLFLVYKLEDKYVEMEFVYGSKRMPSLFFFDDLIKLNKRIDEIEKDSIASI